MNAKGYERARASAARCVAVVVGCSDTLQQKGTNMTLAEARAAMLAVVRRAKADGVGVRAYVAAAFYCPYEGAIDPGVALGLAADMFAAGAGEVVIADTIGWAAPDQVARLFDRLAAAHDPARLAGHFHDTKGLALANCFAALERGVRKFDASIGGLGGCPFAPGAAGNLATEDVVNMFATAGYETGIDLEQLAAAVAVAERCVGRELGGRWMNWRRSQALRQEAKAVRG
jgi:hydroxymethylglutaryl-CoA lyase